jgi:hypothetical protein
MSATTATHRLPLTMGPFNVPHTAQERQRIYVFCITAEVNRVPYTVTRVDAMNGLPGWVRVDAYPQDAPTLTNA